MSGSRFDVVSHWPNDDYAWIVGLDPATGEQAQIDIFGGSRYRIVHAAPRPWRGRSGDEFLTFEIEGTFNAEHIRPDNIRARVRNVSRNTDATVEAPYWPFELFVGDELHLLEFGDLRPAGHAPGQVL